MARITHEQADKYQNSLNGEWFSLKNHGDIARVQFMHDSMEDLDIFACHKVSVNDKDRYVDCLRTYDEPVDNCPFCSAGLPVKPVRFIQMYQHDDEKVKIWERGPQFITKLQGLFNRYNPLSSYVFEIERNGKAGSKDTKYEVFPMDQVPAYDLTEIERPQILGGLILEKGFAEMEEYLTRGEFPQTDENGTPQTTTQPSRAAQPARAQQPVRRQQAPAKAPQPSSRRGVPAANNDEEVF